MTPDGTHTGRRPGKAVRKRFLRVAAVQMKFAPTVAGNLEKIRRAIATAARRGADAVLFPECATTGYNRDFAELDRGEVRAALAAVGALAAAHRVNVLVGSPVPRGRRWFNTLVVFDRRGRVTHAYSKCQLTARDCRWFSPGDHIALFRIDGVCCTAIVCHERRYPELVRLAVMAGARVLFHPNAGLDSLAVSRRKRNGRDGIAVRAFENAIHYVFANSVGPQGGGLWSAGDSKVVAPDGRVLALADNTSESIVVADLDLAAATGRYAQDSLEQPRFLSRRWQSLVRVVRERARRLGRGVVSSRDLRTAPGRVEARA